MNSGPTNKATPWPTWPEDDYSERGGLGKEKDSGEKAIVDQAIHVRQRWGFQTGICQFQRGHKILCELRCYCLGEIQRGLINGLWKRQAVAGDWSVIELEKRVGDSYAHGQRSEAVGCHPPIVVPPGRCDPASHDHHSCKITEPAQADLDHQAHIGEQHRLRATIECGQEIKKMPRIRRHQL
jgi:hypothetical protein